MWSQTAPIFMSPHILTSIIACTVQFWVYATSQGLVMWFPEVINRIADYNENQPNARITICEIIKSQQRNTTTSVECAGTLDTSSYQITLLMEFAYTIGFAVIGSIISSVGKLPIIIVNLGVCGFFGILSVFTNIPMLGIYFYLILILCGFSSMVVIAATVDLYPTNFRAMAICMFMMMGRLGSAFGTNFYGFLIDNYCSMCFLTSGISLIFCGIISCFIPDIRRIDKIKSLK